MREEMKMQDTKEIDHIFDELNNKTIEYRLKEIKALLSSAQSEVDMLTKQRKELVALGFSNNISIIKIGELLGITRQRVYRILDTVNEEE